MSATKPVEIGRRQVNLHTFSGEVLDAKKWTRTEVSGGGSTGGYLHNGTGYVSGTAPITSTTTTHDQFFLRNANGREIAVEVWDMHLAMRPSHKVSVAWGIKEGKEEGSYVAVYNHTTEEASYSKKGIWELAGSKLLAWVGAIVGILGFFNMFGNFWVGLPTAAVGGWMLYAQLVRVRTLQSAVTALVSEIRTMPSEMISTPLANPPVDLAL